MGYLDEESFLILSGRKKEIIITGGINVYPGDVEGCLMQHPFVKECAVIGVPDRYFGEAVLAIIVTDPDHPENIRALQIFANKNLANYQQPMAYEIIPEMPRNPIGKINKRALIEQYKAYDATARMRAILQGG